MKNRITSYLAAAMLLLALAGAALAVSEVLASKPEIATQMTPDMEHSLSVRP